MGFSRQGEMLPVSFFPFSELLDALIPGKKAFL
jgi:hypothetical protein